MKTSHKSPTRRTHSKPTLLVSALIGAFTIMGQAQAQNLYNGAGAVDADTSWSAGVKDNGDTNIINQPPAAWQSSTGTQVLNFPTGLSIGSAATGQFDLGVPADTPFALVAPSPTLSGGKTGHLQVGEQTGTGTFNIKLEALSAPAAPAFTPRGQIATNNASIGVGSGATGTMNLLGGGKSSSAADIPPWAVFAQSAALTVGDSGTGSLNIKGAGLALMSGKFTVGTGTTGNGKVDVLGGGKLGTFLIDALTAGKMTQVGTAGGTGVITVEPTDTLRNRAMFHTGIIVGNGGTGTLDVLQGGKALASNGFFQTSCTAQTPSLLIGEQPGYSGVVRAIGAGTELLVSGKQGAAFGSPAMVGTSSVGSVHIGDTGTLVAGDQGSVQVGIHAISVDMTTFDLTTQSASGLGTINIDGHGALVYGSDTTAIPTGSVKTGQILLNAADSQIRFNITDSLTFDQAVSGPGQLVQQSGTTTLSNQLAAPPDLSDTTKWDMTSSGCAPATTPVQADQSAFTGTVVVNGGALVMPTTNILPSQTATNISGGRLTMGNTSQRLGAVTMTGGILDLSGGLSTDVATATSWTGTGGTVILDTILDEQNGNISDKIYITGAVTGTTKLQINVTGGTGALTTGDGIQLVVGDQANAASHFELASVVSNNGYDYSLKQVGNNWYLQSALAPVTPPPPPPAPAPSTATPVPANTPGGLLGLGALMAAVAGFALRRRRA